MRERNSDPPDGSPRVGADGALRSLVMIVASSWRWPLTQDKCDRHRDFLTLLLDAPNDPSFRLVFDHRLRPPPGAEEADPESADPEPADAGPIDLGPDAAPADAEPVDLQPADPEPRVNWSSAAAARAAVVDFHRRLSALCPKIPSEDAEQLRELTQSLQDLRHRVYLDAAGFRALTGDHDWTGCPDLPFVVVLDFHFVFYLRQFSCHVSVSVWSDKPVSHGFSPPAAEDVRGDGSLAEYAPAFTRHVAPAAEQLLARHLRQPNEVRVFGRLLDLPTFWVAVPAEQPTRAADYLAIRRPADPTAAARAELVDQLSQTLLAVGAATDCVVVPTVIGGGTLVLRRFLSRAAEERDTPLYLMLPLLPGAGTEDADRLRHDQVAGIIATLTELEGYAGSRLYQAEDDILLFENHTKIYDATAERAAFLWDALSAHLPMRRGKNRDDLHKAIMLMHQILIQGVADIGHLVAQTRRSAVHVGRTEDTLLEKYDRRLTENHPWHADGLRAALTRTGVLDEARQRAERAAEEAERIKSRWEHQLAAIKSALEEWRVRETDLLQRANWVLTVVLAAVGLVAVLDAVVQMKPGNHVTVFGDDARVAELAAGICLFIGVLLPVGLLVVRRRLRHPGFVASAKFRELYEGGPPAGRRRPTAEHPDGTWQFLADASTDMLDKFARELHRSVAGSPDLDPDSKLARDIAAAWDAKDRWLAARFARLWDAAAALPDGDREGDHAGDIEGLQTRIEKWGIHGLLVTERPRKMHSYVLPRLTILYRACGWLPGSFLSVQDTRSPLYTDLPLATSMVARSDFCHAMSRIGIDWHDAIALDWWLRARVRRSRPGSTGQPWTATALLAEVEAAGIRPGMSMMQRKVLLGRAYRNRATSTASDPLSSYQR